MFRRKKEKMKEQIYTIPLNDAMDMNTLCPLCAIYEKEEKDLVEYTLGPSMMEPDSREQSNKEGFCREHLRKMLTSDGNKLSMALMLSTHFDGILGDLGTLAKKTPHPVVGMFKKKDPGVDISSLEKRLTSCVMCRKINKTMQRYSEVFLYLWDTEKEFKCKVDSSRGFCEKHLCELISLAPHKLKEEPCRIFVSSLLKLRANQAEEDKAQLLGFIDQFDYQKRSENPSDYKNALSDVVTRLQGR